MNFRLPSRLKNEKNEERRAGFEFEFAGLKTEETAALITALWGGKVEKKNRFDLKVAGTSLGDFAVELDMRLLKNEEHLGLLEKLGVEGGKNKSREHWEDWIESTANVLVPYEVSTPPLPLSQLPEVEKLRRAMQRHHALGTKAKMQYAFGMHLNPEAPDLSTATLLNILRSFLLHYPWLVQKLEVDWARRLAPFINPFPDSYFKVVLSPLYQPDMALFISDYLEHNPSRNRPLDMLPLFCLIDEPRIRQGLPEEKIKARPAFHYRLPNCLLDDPDWNISNDWNYWIAVEELATDTTRLSALSAALLDEMEAAPLLWQGAWAKRFAGEMCYD